MKKVSQEIPNSQKDIIIEALNALEAALNSLKIEEENENLNHKLFDIRTLKAMLNRTELVVNLPFDVYEDFTFINGIDFPLYS